MHRSIFALGGATMLLLGLLVPVAAAAGSASSAPFSWSDGYDTQHACSIVEHVSVEANGRAYFDPSGNWLRDIVRLQYAVTYENTSTGEALVTRTSEIAEFTPETGTLRGQGYFIRGGSVNGVVFPDVGRLVFALGDGSTLFATPTILRFDDPEAAAKVDQALCEALG